MYISIVVISWLYYLVLLENLEVKKKKNDRQSVSVSLHRKHRLKKKKLEKLEVFT